MRILLIEDDEALCRVLQPSLQAAGFASDCCHSGADGLALLKTGCYDACILDRMLPELDGLQLLHQARSAGVTAPGADADGPGPGGRPGGRAGRRSRRLPDQAFSTPGSCWPGCGALVRRPAELNGAAHRLACGDLTLDTAQLTLTGPAATVTVSRRECDLLAVFCRAPGLLRGRALLLGSVWGADAGVEGRQPGQLHPLCAPQAGGGGQPGGDPHGAGRGLPAGPRRRARGGGPCLSGCGGG